MAFEHVTLWAESGEAMNSITGKGDEKMTPFEKFRNIIATLRSPGGCPWDREQTHDSLKATCIEEAAEVICGINVYNETGNPENLKEELGDLLLQVVIQAQIAEEEGLFDIDDVIEAVSEKMIRRHPHVFGDVKVLGSEEVLENWEKIKAREKIGKEDAGKYLPQAFEESKQLIERAKKRKGYTD